MSNSYNFDLVDEMAPDQVINEVIKDIETDSRGYVSAHLAKYDGPIYSYKTTRETGLSAMSTLMTPKTIEVDIQDRLGELGNEEKKYELYLSVKGIEKYKYRIMFVAFGTITYPVTIVLNDDIADDIFSRFSYVQEVDSMEDLNTLMQQVLSCHSLTKVIQNLINEALRKERKIEKEQQSPENNGE